MNQYYKDIENNIIQTDSFAKKLEKFVKFGIFCVVFGILGLLSSYTIVQNNKNIANMSAPELCELTYFSVMDFDSYVVYLGSGDTFIPKQSYGTIVVKNEKIGDHAQIKKTLYFHGLDTTKEYTISLNGIALK